MSFCISRLEPEIVNTNLDQLSNPGGEAEEGSEAAGPKLHLPPTFCLHDGPGIAMDQVRFPAT